MVFVCPSSLLQYLLFVLLHTPLERCILPELVLGKSPELRLLVVTLRGRDILQHRIRRRQQLETNIPRLAFSSSFRSRCILCLATLSEKTGRLGYFRRFTSFPRHVDHFEHPA